MIRAGRASDLPGGEWVLRARPVDDYQDIVLMVGATGGYGFMGSSPGRELAREAADSFPAANNGSAPIDAAQLTPFLKRPVETAILQKYFADFVAAKSSR